MLDRSFGGVTSALLASRGSSTIAHIRGRTTSSALAGHVRVFLGLRTATARAADGSRRRRNHIIRTLYCIHDNTRNRTMVRIAHRVLVWVRHTCNVLIHITTHGVIVRETTAPVAQYIHNIYTARRVT